MRRLSDERVELLDAILAESGHADLSAALLEKDEHLTDALRALFDLQLEGMNLALCGGTSLAKAFEVIERMSEDVDLKVVLHDDAAALSRSRMRSRLRDLKSQVIAAVSELGFTPDAGTSIALNEHRYIHTRWAYTTRYGRAAGLRPHLQIELVMRAPALPLERRQITSLAGRLSGEADSPPFDAWVVSPAETMAEKVLSFLRRLALHRGGRMIAAWDQALVRHIYDVHCLIRSDPALLAAAGRVFPLLVAQDAQEPGRRHPDFAAAPFKALSLALTVAADDAQTQQEYRDHLLPLIYGSYRPDFDEAFESFREVAVALLATLER